MEDKILKTLGYWTLGLILFVSTFIIIRWAVDFATWSTLDSGWAQAIGSVAAIWFAYVFGERQAKVTLASVHEAEKIAAQRRYDSILAVADSAKAYAEETYKCFSATEALCSFLRTNYSSEQLKNIVDTLQAIPAHELISYKAVSALLNLRDAMGVLLKNVDQAVDKCRTTEPPPDYWYGKVSVDMFPIDLSLNRIRSCVGALHAERSLIN